MHTLLTCTHSAFTFEEGTRIDDKIENGRKPKYTGASLQQQLSINYDIPKNQHGGTTELQNNFLRRAALEVESIAVTVLAVPKRSTEYQSSRYIRVPCQFINTLDAEGAACMVDGSSEGDLMVDVLYVILVW